MHVTGATRASKKRSTRATSVRRHHHCLRANRGMCDHALPGMCEHALPTWSEVIRDPSDFKEETLLHVLADDVILKISSLGGDIGSSKLPASILLPSRLTSIE